ncbi:sugar-binding transcriptional regulator [Jiangella asiatica]|nr:sugar-binding domain-containing protein [Jiangella asiatica]
MTTEQASGGELDSRPTSDERTRAPLRDDELNLTLEIARRYYFLDQTKVAISRELAISRFQVARLLEEARRRNIVRIEVGVPGRMNADLADALRKALGIERVLVIETASSSHDHKLHLIGAAVGQEIAGVVEQGSVLGLTWSRAVRSMVSQLDHLKPCTVVQLAGHLPVGDDGDPGSVELVRQVATVAGGSCLPIYAPMVVPDAGTADALKSLPDVARALDMAESCNTAVLSVGAWKSEASQVFDVLSPAIRQEAANLGAIGEMGGRAFNRDGEPINSVIDQRIVGITLDALRSVDRVVITAFGAHRSEATVAATRTGLIHTLVVDEDLARAILDDPGAPD